MIENFRTDLICAAILFAAAMMSLGLVSHTRGWVVFASLALAALAFTSSAAINGMMVYHGAAPSWAYALLLALIGGSFVATMAAIGLTAIEA